MDYKTQVINGTTYAFIDKSHWNSEKKRGEHKRKYIGKVIEGKLVFNKMHLQNIFATHVLRPDYN